VANKRPISAGKTRTNLEGVLGRVDRPPLVTGTRVGYRILGVYSRALDRGSLGSIVDGRSREGRFLRSYEAMLTKHVGGKPSLVQRALITRAARVALHLELMDERSLRDGHVFGIHDHNYYVSWSNSLARILGRLGVEAVGPPPPVLDDVVANIVSRRRGKAAA
jgi:hypothetical protein